EAVFFMTMGSSRGTGFVWAACLMAAAHAQPMAGTGSISGTVRDVTSAVVVDAAIDVVNQARGIRRATRTDSGGKFTVMALDPAPGYSVTVTKTGFAVYEEFGVDVLVGEVTNLEVVLKV